MTQIEMNRIEMSQRLNGRREAKRIEAINAKLAEEEEAYRAHIREQMDCGYLFGAINSDKWDGDVPLRTESVTDVVGEPAEWWDEYPCLYAALCGGGIMLALTIFAQFIAGAMGW
jgi:hypothetical protein